MARTKLDPSSSASADRVTVNGNEARANWHNVLEIGDGTTALEAIIDDPELLHDALRMTATAADSICTLPPGSATENERVVWVHATAADVTNSVILRPDGSDKVNGVAADYVITAPGFVIVRYRQASTDWEIIG